MKGTYVVIFISAIVVLTFLTLLALSQITTPEGEYESVVKSFNWVSAVITFLNFSFTTILLVLAHLIIYRRMITGKGIYIVLSLPYLLFITFTLVNYLYVYELYNVYQEINLKPIDTPEMDVFALNVAMFALIIGGINLALVYALRKVT